MTGKGQEDPYPERTRSGREGWIPVVRRELSDDEVAVVEEVVWVSPIRATDRTTAHLTIITRT